MHPCRKCLLIGAAVAQFAFAQQSTTHARIICKPPTVKIVKMVRPTVSPDAKVVGSVSVQVVVDKEGRPSTVKLLKGHPILAAAVLDAVKQWRWKPMTLNGVAVEVETTITVNFEPR